MRLDRGRIVYEGVSLQFGSGTPYRLTGFKRGVAEREDADVRRPRSDGSILGRSFKGKAQHSLSLLVDAGKDEDAAMDLLGELEDVWDAAANRVDAGFMAELWIGDDRYCIGQPRALDPDDTGLWDGTATADLTFVAESDRWYGPTVSVTVGLMPTVRGGLRLPARAPFFFDSGPTDAFGTIRNTGSLSAWPVFEVKHAITNPVVGIEGVGRLIVNYDLKYDQTLTLDTRPATRGVYVNGVPIPGLLSASGQRLADMAMPSGTHQVTLRGRSPGSATLTCRVAPTTSSFRRSI